MDPLSIASASAGLLSSIASLTLTITKFVSSVRNARNDMDGVRRELSSLQLCVEALQNDIQDPQIQYPPSLQRSLVDVLRNCDGVTKEMETLLKQSTANSLGKRIKWAAIQQDEMNKLRLRLEAHKATINIALEMVMICLVTAVKEDTVAVREQTVVIAQNTAHVPDIKADTTQLLDEIAQLRLRLAQTQPVLQDRTYILQRYLDETTSYAETVMATDGLDIDALTPKSAQHSFEHDRERMHDDGVTRDAALRLSELQQVSAAGQLQNSYDLAYLTQATMTRGHALSNSPIASSTTSARQQFETMQLDERPSNFPSDVDRFAQRRLRRAKLEPDEKSALDDELWQYVTSEGEETNAEQVRAYLDRGADINQQNLMKTHKYYWMKFETAMTLLYFAVGYGSAKSVRLLLAEGADVNAEGGRFGNALQAACCQGEVKVVELLLNRGADVNAQGGAYGNALQAACCKGEVEVVELLLYRGADVNAQGGNYGTSLAAASYNGKTGIVRLLLNSGANINAYGSETGTALLAAICGNGVAIVNLLLDRGADIHQLGDQNNDITALTAAKETLEGARRGHGRRKGTSQAIRDAEEILTLVQEATEKAAKSKKKGGSEHHHGIWS